ncbi:MAG: hypothetical protein V4515_15185 [Chloroflexota bacterium]
MAKFLGRGDPEYSDSGTTDPMIREDLALAFDSKTRSYHYIPPDMPDAVDIGSIILQLARALHGPDAHAIIAAGCGEQLHRLLGQLAASAGLAVSGAIKDALHGLPS